MSAERGSLFHWRRDIEADVRLVMRAEEEPDLSVQACRLWARAFIQRYVPWWTRGGKLSWTELQEIGAAFSLALARASQKRDALAWQERANTTARRRAK